MGYMCMKLKSICLALPLVFANSAAAEGVVGQPPETDEPKLVSPPSLVKTVSAEIPPGTVFPGPQVAVLLELEGDEQGRVASVKVSEGAGEPFDRAAVDAARQFAFKPALLDNGQTAPVSIAFRPPRAETDADPSTGKDETTAARGRFVLKVPRGEFALRALAEGHSPLSVQVKARPGETVEERFYLEQTAGAFVTVVQSERVKREVTRRVLPKAAVEKMPGTADDTLKVLQILPGVARASFDAGLVVLRGASPDDSRVFLEGQEIPILYHFGGIRSTVGSTFLKAVEFVPGNVGAEYGRATGGIVINRLSLRSTWTYQPWRWLALRAGVDIRNEWVDIELNSPIRPVEGEQTPPLATRQFLGVDKTSTLFNPGVFVEAQLTPVDDLTMTFALRLDGYPEIERLTVDPRLTVRYEPRDGTALKLGFGAYHQPPSADQSDPDSGSPDLRAPGSLHLSLGAEQRIVEGVTAEVTGFYKWLDSQVIRNPGYLSNPGLSPYLSAGSGRIYGVELLVKAMLTERFMGWLSYTFQRSFRSDGPDAEERLFSFDQPHILSLAGTYFFGKGWSAGLRFRLVSGNPITPVTGSVYDANSDTHVPLYGPTNSDRAALFHQLDLRVDKTFTFDLWKLSLYLDVQNVYNQRNPEGRSYNFDYSQSQPISGLPILPIIGIKGSW